MKASPILTAAIIADAIEAMKPTLQYLLADGKLKRGTMHVVVANPTLPVGPNYSDHVEQWMHVRGILYEQTVVIDGEPCDPTPFVNYARLKAYQTWRHGQPTADVAARLPHLLREGDTIYGGSATYAGLICAVSGQPAIMDEALAGMLLNLIVGQCRMVAAEMIPRLESGILS